METAFNNNNINSVPIRLSKRTLLTVKQKFEICQFKAQNPDCSHQNLADHFNEKWGKRMSRRVIGDIIADKHKWKDTDEESLRSSKRLKNPRQEEMECLLESWITDMNNRAENITDLDITEKAKLIGKEVGIPNFQYSYGWLMRFKKRRGLLARSSLFPIPYNTEASKFNEGNSNFFTDALNSISNSLYNNFNLDSNSATEEFEDILSITTDDSDPAAFEEFLNNPIDLLDQDTLDLFEKSTEVTLDDAKYALSRLRLFFTTRLDVKSEVLIKLNDLEDELSTYDE